VGSWPVAGAQSCSFSESVSFAEAAGQVEICASVEQPRPQTPCFQRLQSGLDSLVFQLPGSLVRIGCHAWIGQQGSGRSHPLVALHPRPVNFRGVARARACGACVASCAGGQLAFQPIDLTSGTDQGLAAHQLWLTRRHEARHFRALNDVLSQSSLRSSRPGLSGSTGRTRSGRPGAFFTFCSSWRTASWGMLLRFPAGAVQVRLGQLVNTH